MHFLGAKYAKNAFAWELTALPHTLDLRGLLLRGGRAGKERGRYGKRKRMGGRGRGGKGHNRSSFSPLRALLTSLIQSRLTNQSLNLIQ